MKPKPPSPNAHYELSWWQEGTHTPGQVRCTRIFPLTPKGREQLRKGAIDALNHPLKWDVDTKVVRKTTIRLKGAGR